MATQSLYRRYRPRRFAELKGQDHVVRALRDAVRTGREGQAYLFSGPRGTGKTSSARILAKVLNCKQPVDGEPCCECESCLEVERGTSYDVHELDAASNNGVDDIRDLIEKASLGTPGRHKVYILDEVHMLTKPAEAALLKTLEEPPPHVVFVLATTDPQKMSATIRSRTQHLQFHLLPADTLAEHVRWVAADAGLELPDEAFDAVVSQGAGSVRDALSALELMVATGGDTSEQVDLDLFVRALAERDTAAALTAVAIAVRAGHDPRTLTEAIVRHLRDGFLSLLAPEVVQLPTPRVDEIALVARELGAAGLVRAIERLGVALVDMRHAPDPRVLLDVALVTLTHDEAADDLGAINARLDRLEQAVRSGAAAGGAGGSDRPAPPVDPSTGRAVLGGRAKRTAPTAADATAPAAATTSAATSAATSATSPPPARATPTDTATAGHPTPADPSTSDHPAAAAGAVEPSEPDATPADAATSGPVGSAGSGPDAASPGEPETTGHTTADTAGPARITATPGGAGSAPDVATASPAVGVIEAWDSVVRPGLPPFVRALYSAGTFTRHDGDTWYFSVPSAPHGQKCETHRAAVEAALSGAVGAPVHIEISVGGSGTHADADGSRPTPRPATSTSTSTSAPPAGAASPGPTGADRDTNRHPARDSDDDIDLDDLVDAPPESVVTPIDRLAQAFPGAELVDPD